MGRSKNKIKKSKGYRMLPSTTPLQKYMESLTKNIKDPHCLICGDTLEDGNLVKIKTIYNKIQYLCDTCFECQKNM